MLRKIIAVALGTVLYPVLGWIIVLGPIMSGFAVGWIARCKPKEGFILGSVSAFLGFLLLMHALNVLDIDLITLSDVLVFWAFMLWNLFGFLLAGVGGVLGSILSKPMESVHEAGTQKKTVMVEESPAEVYVVCPACGHGNSEEDEYCKSCGTKLVG